MEIQIDKLTLGQTIEALKKTSEGLTQLEIEYPDNYIIRKIMTMKQLVDHLNVSELVIDEADYYKN
tara:strand:- start:1523 stop:1720 length:198 start_codon:yes stop_codon:yes gene_type:complete